MSKRAVCTLVTRATNETYARNRCVWGQGWPFEDNAVVADAPCPNESDLEITIGRRGQTEVHVCGEHFTETAALMLEEWRRSMEISA